MGQIKNYGASAANHWKSLYSDDNASFDSQITIDCTDLKPTVTWGTSPQHAVSIDDKIPDPRAYENSETIQSMTNALHYMDLSAGTPIRSIKIDAAFIGSCTNSRLSDLRSAAQYLKGKRVCSWVSAICVPDRRRLNEKRKKRVWIRYSLRLVFLGERSGCSMCFYAGGETFGQGKRVISSTNRNFEGRQGPSTRTHLASPLTVAASACTGYICPAEL